MTEASQGRAELVASIQALTIAISARAIPAVLEPLLRTKLTIQQLRVLSLVVTMPAGATGAQLARDFGVSMATTSKLIDRLVEQGMLERRPDPDDLRVRRLHATPLGRAVVRELMAARPELGEDVLAELELDDLRALERGVRAVSERLRDRG